MRKSLALAAAALLAASAATADSVKVLELTFESDAVTGTPLDAAAAYTGADVNTLNASINGSDPTGPADPDVDNLGTIAANPGTYAGTAEGTKSLYVTGRQGMYIAMYANTPPEYKLTDYTIEVLIAFDLYPGPNAEFSIVNILSTSPGTNNTAWELRGLGTFGSPENEVMLMTDSDTGVGGDENHDLSDFVPAVNKWYKIAITRESEIDRMTVAVTDTETDTTTTTVIDGKLGSAHELDDFTLGYWPNDNNTNRDMIGYIDRLTVYDNNASSVNDWSLY